MVETPKVPCEIRIILQNTRTITIDLRVCFSITFVIPTVCPSVASRNLLLYQSLPVSIPSGYTLLRRRNDAHRVGTAARGIVEGLHRFPRRVRLHGGPSARLRGALLTRAWDRSQPAQRAPLSGRPSVRPGRQEC